MNVVGTVRLLAELRKLRDSGAADPLVLVIGSGEQYGNDALDEMPLEESAEQRPISPYAASKAAQEIAALQVSRRDGLRVICTRSFNHSGVGHAPHFLLPALVSRALELPSTGGRLTIGNGDTVRDYLHVSDTVAAYIALLENGVPREAYNVCSGVGRTVASLAATVLDRLGISAEVHSETALMRPVDVPVLIGNNAKLVGATGWAPDLSLDNIIDDLIHASTR